MIGYAIAGFVLAAGSFVAGAFYGKKWEQEAIAELVKAEQYGKDLYAGIVADIKARVKSYL